MSFLGVGTDRIYYSSFEETIRFDDLKITIVGYFDNLHHSVNLFINLEGYTF